MLIGDIVETEIYGPVTIENIFRSIRKMVADGYAIPTGQNDTGFQVNGKVVCGTRRTYAAAPLDVHDRNDMVAFELPVQDSSNDDGTPQQEFTFHIDEV